MKPCFSELSTNAKNSRKELNPLKNLLILIKHLFLSLFCIFFYKYKKF